MLVELTGLAKQFGTLAAVDGVSLAIAPGELVALLGPNGAGKTTLLRILTGTLAPSTGTARVGGLDCFADRARVMADLGYVPDEPVFYDYLRGREVIEFVSDMRGLAREVAAARAGSLVEIFQLGSALEDFAVNYSRGMKKKLALILAFLHDPALLVLDEPLNGLDPYAVRALNELLRERATRGKAVITSTHLLAQAEGVCTRAIIMARGKVIADGTLDALRAQSQTTGSLEEVFFALASAEPT